MTNTQQQIMIYLAGRVDAKSSDIRLALGISPATLGRVLPELYEEDYIKKTKVGSLHVVRYSLTDEGMSVANRLIRYHSFSGEVVPSNRIDKLAGTYTPPASYQRNGGLKEVQSKGTPC